MRVWIGVLPAVVLAAGLAGLLAPAPARAGPEITVTGEGSVARAPDMATISVGVTAEAKTAAAAMAQASAQLGAVLKRLIADGIAERDMQSTGLNLSPRWQSGSASSGQPRKIVGFVASGTILVKVRALGRLGNVLDDVVKDGANRLHGLSFGLAEPGPVEDAARKAAVADAMRKAALYATAAGVKLGPVQSIAEAGGSAPVPMLRAAPMSMAAAPVPVAQGEVTVKAKVRMVFAIAE
jgi:uncharacterized protein YggE